MPMSPIKQVAAPQDGRRTLVVIRNPTSRHARGQRFAAVLAALETRGCQIEVRETEAAGHAIALARDAIAGGCDAVVAAGGDGTINEVLNGVAGSAMPFAILPLGTANVLARELGLSLAPDAIADAIVGGDARPVPLGRLRLADGTLRYFVLMAGIGVDAHVVAAVNQALKRRLGKAAYVLCLLQQLGGFNLPRYRVEIDGAAYEAASVIVAKAQRYGGAYTCAPAARLHDTHFHVCLFERSGRVATVRYVLALARGKLAARTDYRIVTGRQISITGPHNDPVQADGDLVAGLPVEIDMVDAALSLVTPL